VKVEKHSKRLTPANARALIRQYDLVADGSDNFDTRYLVNDACFLERKPLVTAAVLRFEGQATTIKAWEDGKPCYRCIFPSPPPPEIAPRCEQAGIFGALAGVLGTIQATEVLKELLGLGKGLAGRLLLYDAMDVTLRTVNIPKNPACPLCGEMPSIKDVA
jgi:adenylyltransferase/sulfurtransferase